MRILQQGCFFFAAGSPDLRKSVIDFASPRKAILPHGKRGLILSADNGIQFYCSNPSPEPMNPQLFSGLPVIQHESWRLLTDRIWILASVAVFMIYMISGIRRKIPLSQLLLGAATFFLCFTLGSTLATLNAEDWHQLFAHGQWPLAGSKTIVGGLAGMLAAILLIGAGAGRGNRIFDLVAAALPVGACIQRVSCLLSGCCAGTPTSLPWGIRYDRHADVWESQVSSGQITAADPCSLPVHPTQVYEIIGWIFIFFIAARAARYFRSPGNRLLLTLMLYGIFRFFLEFLRESPIDLLPFPGIKPIQWMILAGLPLAMLVMIARERRQLQAGHREVPEEEAFARQLILTLVVVALFTLTWRLFYLPGILAMTLLLLSLFILTAAKVFINTPVPGTRHALLLLCFASLMVFPISCTKSPFATTTRQYKNGKAVYTNHYSNERRNLHRSKAIRPATSSKPEASAGSEVAGRDTLAALNLMASTGLSFLFNTRYHNTIRPNTGRSNTGSTIESSATPTKRSRAGLTGYDSKSPGKTSGLQRDKTIDRLDTIRQNPEGNGQPGARKNERLGEVGFFLSILGFIPVIGIPFSILGIVFGARSLRKISRNPEKYKGRGFAIAGIAIGCVTLILNIVFITGSVNSAVNSFPRNCNVSGPSCRV
jgi:phosphatidylglycerol:prolipoprotein diacylglycerol transferase